MHRVLVAEGLSVYCGTVEEGDQLYEKVKRLLVKGEKVLLDFDGVEIASSSFFGTFIYRLHADYGSDALGTQVKYCLLLPRLQFVLNHTLTAMHSQITN
ncbi:MAG: STAS-like domain-containing protein [Nitrospira sp.]